MTLSSADLIAIVLALVGLIVGIAAFLRAHPNATPAALDAEVVRLLAERQADREFVGRLERAYQTSGTFQKQALDTLAGALRVLAPLTPVKTDDALAKLLDDILTPDAEGDTQPMPPVTPPRG